jgi:hypothetical protein
MDASFCGIPCTLPNQWKLDIHIPVVESAPQSSPPVWRNVVTPQLQSLDFYADYYSEHHTCCWPRTLLDAHIGQAAEAVSQISVDHRRDRYDSVAGKCKGEADDAGRDISCTTQLLGSGNHARVFTQHIIQVAEQLYRAQQERRPRAPHPRRIVFHNAVPPVLRCSDRGESLVYVLQGQVVLCHVCKRLPSTRQPNGSPAWQGQNASCRGQWCTHAQLSDAVARDVFPPFLIMAPSQECAGYFDSEVGSASDSNRWHSKPLVLALESITRTGDATQQLKCDDNASVHVATVSDGVACWRAAYSPFTWLCNPLGNAQVSPLVRTGAAVTRLPRRCAHSRTSKELFQQHKKSSSLRFSSDDGSGSGGSLSPLPIKFAIYATAYTSTAAKKRILAEMGTSQLYIPHVTQLLRFGFRGGDTGEESEEQLSLARSRRPRQIMHLLESKLKYPISEAGNADAAQVSADALAEADDKVRGPVEHSHDGESCPPFKVPRKKGCDEASTARGAVPGSSQVAEVPCAQMVLLGVLRTTRPVVRERCVMPKATTLSAVIPKTQRPEHQGDGTAENNTDGSGQQSTKGGWPLRITVDRPSDASAVVTLSPLSTLQELASALRRVCK